MIVRIITKAAEKDKRNMIIRSSPKIYHSMIVSPMIVLEYFRKKGRSNLIRMVDFPSYGPHLLT